MPNNPRLETHQKSAIIQFLNEHFNAHTMILFGSAARGELRPDGDVDIAYLSDEPTPSAYELIMAALGRTAFLRALKEYACLTNARKSWKITGEGERIES